MLDLAKARLRVLRAKNNVEANNNYGVAEAWWITDKGKVLDVLKEHDETALPYFPDVKTKYKVIDAALKAGWIRLRSYGQSTENLSVQFEHDSLNTKTISAFKSFMNEFSDLFSTITTSVYLENEGEDYSRYQPYTKTDLNKILQTMNKNINRTKVEASEDQYGYWFTDEGVSLDVDEMQHDNVASKIIAKKHYNEYFKWVQTVDEADYKQFAMKILGWIRVTVTGSTLGVEIYPGAVSDKAYRAFTKFVNSEAVVNEYLLDVIDTNSRFLPANRKQALFNDIKKQIKKNTLEAALELVDQSGAPLKYIIDPTPERFIAFISKTEHKSARGLINEDKKTIWWDAGKAIHSRIAKQLMLTGYLDHRLEANVENGKVYVDYEVWAALRDKPFTKLAASKDILFKNGSVYASVPEYTGNTLESSEDPYGYWITNKGELLKVVTDIVGHIAVFDKYRKANGIEYTKEELNAIDEADYWSILSKGWIRIALERYDSCNIEIAKDKVTLEAYRKLTHLLKHYRDKDYMLDINLKAGRDEIEYEESSSKNKILSLIERNIERSSIEASDDDDDFECWISNEGTIYSLDSKTHGKVFKKLMETSPLNKEFEKGMQEHNKDAYAGSSMYPIYKFATERGWIRVAGYENYPSVMITKGAVDKRAYNSLVKHFKQYINKDTEVRGCPIDILLPDNKEKNERFDKPEQLLKTVRDNIKKNSKGITANDKIEITIDDANNILPDNSQVIESWSNPEGYKIHLVQKNPSKFVIVSYSPTGQIDEDMPEYAFLETARERLLEMVNDVRGKTAYARLEANEGDKVLERYESANGTYAVELSTDGKSYNVVQYILEPIAKIWKKNGTTYAPTKERGEANLQKFLNDVKSMNFKKVDLEIHLNKPQAKDYKVSQLQPKIPGLELQTLKIGANTYARIIHLESGRVALSFSKAPLKVTVTELVKRMDLSKDLASIDWTKSAVTLNQKYGQGTVNNAIQRFIESLDLPLPQSISTRSGRTQLIMEDGLLKDAVKNWLLSYYFARPAAMKNTKQRIDERIAKEGLDPEEVYSYYGDYKDAKQKVWEKIGLVRVGERSPYKYEFANKQEVWDYEKASGKTFYKITVNGKSVVDIAVKDEALVQAIVALGNGKASTKESVYFKDLRLVKDLKNTSFALYDLMSEDKKIGVANNPPFSLYGILFKLRVEPDKKATSKIAVKTTTKAAPKPATKETADNNRMVGFLVKGENSKGKEVNGILIKQKTVKGRTSGTLLYLKSGKPVQEEVTRVFRVYESASKALKDAANLALAKIRTGKE